MLYQYAIIPEAETKQIYDSGPPQEIIFIDHNAVITNKRTSANARIKLYLIALALV